MGTLTGNRNYILNPSAENNVTDGFSALVNSGGGTGATVARDATTSYVGNASFKFLSGTSTTANGFAYIEQIIDGLSAKNVYSFSARTRNSQSVGVPYIEVRWYSGAAGTGSLLQTDTQQQAFGTFFNSDISTVLAMYGLLSPSSAVSARVRIGYIVSVNNATTCAIWFDGVLFNDGTKTTYIDGDQGANYSWDGTAHNSTSRRGTITYQDSVGTGGLISLKAIMYRSNKAGDKLEDISDDIMEGQVVFDQNSEIKLSFTGKLRDISKLTPYTDFIIPVLQLTYADATVVEEPIGHYILVPATRRSTFASTDGDIDGRGIEWLLSIDEFSKGYKILSGNDFCAEVRSILRAMDLNNFSIPNSGKTVPKKRTWEPGTKKVDVVNALLDSAGFVPIFSGRDGQLRSFVQPSLYRTEPAVLYDAAGRGSDLVGIITETPDMTNFANRVVVIANDAKRDTIRAIARNDNPASPTSIPTLGFTKTITHESHNINNLTDARELATRLLERASRHLIKLEIETLPDPQRNPYEVYTINARQDNGTYAATGNYACTGWTIGFTAAQGSMKHKVERLEIYQ